MAAIIQRPNALYVKFRDPSRKQHWVTVYGGKERGYQAKGRDRGRATRAPQCRPQRMEVSEAI